MMSIRRCYTTPHKNHRVNLLGAVVLFTSILTSCSTLTVYDYAEAGTVIALVSTRATVDEAQQVKDLAAELEAVAHLDRAAIEKVYDSGVARIRNDKLRLALEKLKPKLISQIVKLAQRNPLVQIRVHVVEAAQGIQSGCTIYITAKS